MKKNFLYILILVIIIGSFSPIHFTHAQACTPPQVPGSDGTGCVTPGLYHLLAPLPCDPKTSGYGCADLGNGKGELENFNPTGKNNIGTYLNVMIRIVIGLASVMAVIMIVIGGIQYMTTELISSKEAGKERIYNAVLGLILALGSWTLINQINPDILNADLKTLDSQTVIVDLGGEGSTPITASGGTLASAGISCSGSGGASAVSTIAQSFIGHSTYSMAQRGTVSGGTAYVDCSSYVTEVYTCAGLSNPGGTTAGIFSSATPATSVSADGTTINGTALKVGDLFGWKQGENGEAFGHVMMYIGNGQMIDAQGGTAGVAIRSVSSYAARIKYFKPI